MTRIEIRYENEKEKLIILELLSKVIVDIKKPIQKGKYKYCRVFIKTW